MKRNIKRFERVDCERCGRSYNKDDIELYKGELLCDICIDEVKEEDGCPFDLPI